MPPVLWYVLIRKPHTLHRDMVYGRPSSLVRICCSIWSRLEGITLPLCTQQKLWLKIRKWDGGLLRWHLIHPWMLLCMSMWVCIYVTQPSSTAISPPRSASKNPICPCELHAKPNEHNTPSSSNWQLRLLGRKCLRAPVQIDLEWVHLAALGWQGVQNDSSFTLQINRHQIKFNNHGKHIMHIHFLIFN